MRTTVAREVPASAATCWADISMTASGWVTNTSATARSVGSSEVSSERIRATTPPGGATVLIPGPSHGAAAAPTSDR